MCGRYYKRCDKQKIAESFHVTEVDDFSLPPWDYNVAPHTMQPIIHAPHVENLDGCEQAMQEHQIRRIVIDGDSQCIGIVAQAELAFKDKPEKVSKTVAEISRPNRLRHSESRALCSVRRSFMRLVIQHMDKCARRKSHGKFRSLWQRI